MRWGTHDLRRREPDAGGRVHGLDHVIDQPLEIVVENDDLGRSFVKGDLRTAGSGESSGHRGQISIFQLLRKGLQNCRDKIVIRFAEVGK